MQKQARTATGTMDDRAEVALMDGLEDAIVSWQVGDALERLHEDHRRVIHELYFNGRTGPEVAALLEIPEGTVRSPRVLRPQVAPGPAQRRGVGPVTASACIARRGQLAMAALGALDADEQAELEAHLAICEECRAVNAELRSTVGALDARIGGWPDGARGSGAIAPRRGRPDGPGHR